MTIQETANKYGTLVYTASVDQTITDIVRTLYRSDSPLYYNILVTLNHRIDWYPVPAGYQIQYINPSLVSSISEALKE